MCLDRVELVEEMEDLLDVDESESCLNGLVAIEDASSMAILVQVRDLTLQAKFSTRGGIVKMVRKTGRASGCWIMLRMKTEIDKNEVVRGDKINELRLEEGRERRTRTSKSCTGLFLLGVADSESGRIG